MAEITIYTTRFCPFCIRAKMLLEHKAQIYGEIPVDGDPARRAEMERLSGRHTVPQIWICLLYTSPSPRDGLLSRMPSSA